MPMTREQRIELLKLAREAKAKKKLERDAGGGDKPVAKRSTKKKKDVEEPMEAVVEEPEQMEVEPEADDFDIVIQPAEKKKLAARSKKSAVKEPVKTLELNNDIDVEDDVMVEEIVEIRKKPKKKIVKKIIYESDSADEVEEVVVQNKPKKAAAKVKKVTKPVPLEAPKEPEVKGFNFFNC
jgi:hypothetical protein